MSVKKNGFFVHPQAIVDTGDIGPRTRIWAFSHVLKGARLGRECNVGEGCFIESGVVVGDGVVIKNGVSLWEGVRIEDHAFLGPNCVFTNDRLPRSKAYKRPAPTLVCEGASIGANATVICGIQIGRYALIGAGAVVTRSVPDYAVVVGNPGRVHGFICRCGEKLQFAKGGEAACSCGLAYERRRHNVVLSRHSPDSESSHEMPARCG
jgi:UDP-2-acetamido-3-amino-2,3-dideoxy-glucuronate N-acetyltransferase